MIEMTRDNSARAVEQALSFQTPDRLPIFDGGLQGLEERGQDAPWLESGMNVHDYYWQDVSIKVAREELFSTRIREIRRDGDHAYQDDGWGRIVRTKPGTYFSEPVERILVEPSQLDGIEFDPAGLDERYEEFTTQVEQHRAAGRAVFAKIGGPFIRTTFFRGETEFLIDLATDEPFARALVERVGEHLLQVGLESMRRADLQNTGVWIYDDMCSFRGPMFSPATFERVFLPTYVHMISSLKAAGAKRVILHCDGNLLPLLDMIVDAGIDGINPVEHAAGLDAVKLLEKYQGRLCLFGGVCNTQVLPSGDEDRIRKHVAAIISAGANGGLVIGTHSIGLDIPLKSYEFYRRLVAELGAYKS